MTNPTEPHPALTLGEVRRVLPYVEMQYNAHIDLRTDFEGVVTWAVSADLNVPDEHLPAVLLAGSAPDQPVRALTMRGVSVDLSVPTGYAEFLDITSADLAHFAALFDETANLDIDALTEPLGDRFYPSANRVVIIDRAHLARALRGHGVGRLLIATAFQSFFDDVTLIATYPEPFEDNDDTTSPAYTRAKASVQRTWSSLGFFPFREGVWVKDATRTYGDAHTAELRRRLLP